jgi:hypothetical protein
MMLDAESVPLVAVLARSDEKFEVAVADLFNHLTADVANPLFTWDQSWHGAILSAFIGFGALLGFHHEAGTFVEVDEVGGAFAVAGVEPDGFVIDVGVVAFVLAGEASARDGEQVAELVAEGLEVDPLGGRRGAPAADEVCDGGFRLRWR